MGGADTETSGRRRRGVEIVYTHLRSFISRSMSPPTRSTNSLSLLLSASMIEGSASVEESVLFSVSAGVGLDAGNGEKVGLSTTGVEDKTDVMVNGSA